MKKKSLFISFIIFILLISFSQALDQTTNINACKKGCRDVNKESLDVCKVNYQLCREICTNYACKKICAQEQVACRIDVRSDLHICQKNCISEQLPATCLNGAYNLSDKFKEGCDVCECKNNGKVECKRDNFCNKNTSITEETCKNNGGLYLPLCNGPYFDLVCSQEKFCLCQGNNDSTCPLNYECLNNFISPNKRVHTISGWKNFLGQPLGNIGICVQNNSL